MEWTRNLKKSSSLTRKLVEQLSSRECEKIIDLSPVDLELRHEKLVMACLEESDSETVIGRTADGKSLLLDERQVALLKWQTISYLNTLESVLAAWRHHTADRLILKEQFKLLYYPQKQSTMLETFGEACGGVHCFPAIYEFSAERQRELLEEENLKKPPPRKPSLDPSNRS